MKSIQVSVGSQGRNDFFPPTLQLWNKVQAAVGFNCPSFPSTDE